MSCAGGASPRTPVIATRSGASWPSSIGVEARGDVGAEVALGLDLVDELRGDGVDGDRASGAVVLGDDARAVGGDLGDREARGAGRRAGQAEEPAEVAAGRLRAALDDVTGDDRAGQLVVRRLAPAVVRDRRTDDQRGVGDPAGDDDVGAGAQGGGDAEAAEVGVGGEGTAEVRAGVRRRPRRARSAGSSPSPRATSRSRSARPAGLRPPALETIFTPLSRASPRQSSTWRTKVRA